MEIHHLLTRARGGNVLDQVGETYHLIALCPDHHRTADGGDAYVAGLLIDGFVVWDKVTHRPIYRGSDQYLQQKYGVRNV